jgi:hypothetical protein
LKGGANPFLLYSADHWSECRALCDERERQIKNNPEARASKNYVRVVLGQLWREASDEVKKPYIDKTVENRAANMESAATFQDRQAAWDVEAMGIRREFVKEHPGELSKKEERNMWEALGVYAGVDRKAKRMSGYAAAGEDEDEMVV